MSVRFGKLGALSFNGNKIITTGGGGAILTDDEELADSAKHVTTTSKVPHTWEYRHDEVGFNYRILTSTLRLGVPSLRRSMNLFQLNASCMKNTDLRLKPFR